MPIELRLQRYLATRHYSKLFFVILFNPELVHNNVRTYSIDFQATYENVLTSSFLDRGFIPVVVEDLHSGYEFAIRHCGLADPANPKIIRIKNTLALDHMWVSQKVLEEIQNRDNIEVTDKIRELFAENDDSFKGKEFS